MLLDLSAAETAERTVALSRDLGQYPNPWRLNPLVQAMLHLGLFSEAYDAATMSLDNVFDNGQPQARAAMFTAPGFVYTVKSLE